MSQIIREITIDVSQPNNLRTITAKQNDLNSRFLMIHITNSGDTIKVAPGRTITMNVKRTDNAVRMFYGSVNDDGSITVPLTSWMLELAGSINCDVSIISIEDNQKLSTMQFSIYVEAAVFPTSELENDDQYDVLVDLLGAAEKVEECVEATEEAKEASEEARQAASGVVTIERNTNSPLTFWVGTQEEYDAIVNKELGCFYIISDDTDLEDIYKMIGEVASDVQLKHTPYDISSAVVVEKNSWDECILYKCGNVLTLTVTIYRPESNAIGLDDLIATIQGFVPTQKIYSSEFHTNGGEFSLYLEPDETEENTLIKSSDYVSGSYGATSAQFSITFICK